MMLTKDKFVIFQCPLCLGNGLRKTFSRKKVCSKCNPKLRAMSMIGKKWRWTQKMEEEKQIQEMEAKEKSSHRKTIFTSEQENYYMSPEGEIL